MYMKLVDLYGCAIEVTNLEEAIDITARYMTYRHRDKNFSGFDEQRKAYWTDMHGKLSKIKRQLNAKNRW